MDRLLQHVSITGHKCFLDCLEIMVNNLEVEDLFLSPSRSVFDRLCHFKKHQPIGFFYRENNGHGENSRSAVIQSILQRCFVSYQESQLYFFRECDDIGSNRTDIFLYREVKDVIFLFQFFFFFLFFFFLLLFLLFFIFVL